MAAGDRGTILPARGLKPVPPLARPRQRPPRRWASTDTGPSNYKIAHTSPLAQRTAAARRKVIAQPHARSNENRPTHAKLASRSAAPHEELSHCQRAALGT